MNVLALDVSTKTGWAYFKDGKLESYGTIFPDKGKEDFGTYPLNYVLYTEYLIDRVIEQIIVPMGQDFAWTEVVIEETNSSKNCYSQKQLEFLHCYLIKRLHLLNKTPKYIRTGEWRKATESKMSKEEKALNAKIARIKKKTGKKLAKIDGKVVGRKGRKHVALRVVQQMFGIDLKIKSEDAADAILLAVGFIKGAPICNGETTGGKSASKS